MIVAKLTFADGYEKIYDWKRFGYPADFINRQESFFNTIDILGFSTLAGFGVVSNSCQSNHKLYGQYD